MKELIKNKTMDNKSELDKQYITSIIQDILNTAHSDPAKRKIISHPDKLNFSCPLCGDSAKISSKKRGNLYWKNLFYVCYNDDSCSRTFTKLLKTFNVDMDLDKKLELYDYIEKNVSYVNSVEDVQFNNLDKLFTIDELMDFYKDDTKRHITNLKPLVKGSVVEQYITKKRKISYTQDIYQAIFYIKDNWFQPVIVYLNKVKNKVVSLQVRNLMDGDKRIFKIYDFSKIYNEIHPDIELDPQEKISYDKLSHFYNIFNIDFGRPVNMFEGYIDSLSMTNSIGMIGLNTDLSFLLKEDGITLRFIFDNDGPGTKKARQMIEDNHIVFLWNKFFLDIIKDYKGKHSKYELMLELKNIKDFNKLSSKFKQPIEKMFNFDKYFSNDILDIYYMMDLEQLYKMY